MEGNRKWNLKRRSYRYECVLKKINFYRIYFGDSLNQVYVEADEWWDGVTKNQKGDIRDETTDNLAKWTYEFNKEDNGQWLLVRNKSR